MATKAELEELLGMVNALPLDDGPGARYNSLRGDLIEHLQKRLDKVKGTG